MRIAFLTALAASLAACGSGSGGAPDGTDSVEEDAIADEDPPWDPPADTGEDVAPEVEEDAGPGTLVGEVLITYYWVAYEGDTTCTSPSTTLGTCAGEAIATVCTEFAEAARLEGSARLLDGRTINIDCSCAGGFDCFVVLDGTLFPWGMGSHDNPLVPFVSVATDTSVIAYGTVLYSPDIDGVTLPEGGGTHDGCIRADDVGGGITGMHIDFFAALRSSYTMLDPQIPESITLYRDPPRCDI